MFHENVTELNILRISLKLNAIHSKNTVCESTETTFSMLVFLAVQPLKVTSSINLLSEM